MKQTFIQTKRNRQIKFRYKYIFIHHKIFLPNTP